MLELEVVRRTAHTKRHNNGRNIYAKGQRERERETQRSSDEVNVVVRSDENTHTQTNRHPSENMQEPAISELGIWASF